MTIVHLRRIDASRNLARFYALSIEATLFEKIVLVRRWGRIGTTGRHRHDAFEHREEAERALGDIERRKRRRGYRDIMPPADPCDRSTV